MVIGFVQGGDITLPRFAWIDKIYAAPCKTIAAQRYQNQISRQPCMTAIAIGIRMNEDKLVMKPRRKFIGLIGLMIDPVTAIIQKLA